MLAVVATDVDPDDPLSVLDVIERDVPEPLDGWQRVHMRAAALNHHDLWSLRGVEVDLNDLPLTLGTDAAGVTDDGREVLVHAVLGDPEPGEDETLAMSRHLFSERGVPGTLSDVMIAPARNLVPKPPQLTFAEASCLPTAYLTAYRMLFHKAELSPGARVLVQGAGGGVSTAAIVLGVAAGLEVYVTSRSAEKRVRAEELGARAVIEPGGRLPERVDAVIETVGQATWSHSLKSLKPGGVVVVSGATTGDPPADLTRVFWRQLRIVGSTMGTRTELEQLCRFLVTTGARPVIDSVRPLREARSAFARMEAGEAFGKLVLTG